MFLFYFIYFIYNILQTIEGPGRVGVYITIKLRNTERRTRKQWNRTTNIITEDILQCYWSLLYSSVNFFYCSQFLLYGNSSIHPSRWHGANGGEVGTIKHVSVWQRLSWPKTTQSTNSRDWTRALVRAELAEGHTCRFPTCCACPTCSLFFFSPSIHTRLLVCALLLWHVYACNRLYLSPLVT